MSPSAADVMGNDFNETLLVSPRVSTIDVNCVLKGMSSIGNSSNVQRVWLAFVFVTKNL